MRRFQIIAGKVPPATPFIGLWLSLPTHTPTISESSNPTNQSIPIVLRRSGLACRETLQSCGVAGALLNDALQQFTLILPKTVLAHIGMAVRQILFIFGLASKDRSRTRQTRKWHAVLLRRRSAMSSTTGIFSASVISSSVMARGTWPPPIASITSPWYPSEAAAVKSRPSSPRVG